MEQRRCLLVAGFGACAVVVAAWKVRQFKRQRRRCAGLSANSAAQEPARDVVGYGPVPPDAKWPGGALVAVNFVINLEEGSEPSIPDGDPASCASLCECGSDAAPGVRDLAAEGMFEYGSRCGVWRVLRAFTSRDLPATMFACSLALERQPLLADALRQSDFDICCHGWRWEDHIAMDEGEERERIQRAVASLTRTLGSPPQGWYCRTAPSVNTRRLLVEHGGFVYDSDAYNDDLPYWVQVPKTGASADAAAESADGFVWHLVVPYTLCTNDSKFAPGRAFSTSDSFFNFMRDAVDVLLEEAEATKRPKMMSIGLHPRLIGHPARLRGLQKVLDYVKGLEGRVWVCRRIDIAQHWSATHPPPSSAIGVPAHVMQSHLHGPRLLVTGGAGFVLSNLVHHWLHDDASATAVVVDQQRAWDSQVQALFAPFLRCGRLAFCDGDVTSAATWTKLGQVHGVAFTHIVSGAAVTPTVQEEQSKSHTVLAVNLDGLVRCLEWARMHCTPTLSRFVHVSSDAVLGVPGLVVPSTDEKRLPQPGELPDMSLYALSKVAGEIAVRRWSDLHNLEAVSVRFSDVYGRLDRDTGARNRHNAPYWVCRKALMREREGEKHRIRVAAESLDEVGWDLIDAESAARGVASILQAKTRPSKSVYHLALGRCVTHRELVEAATGVDAELCVELIQPSASSGGGADDAAVRGRIDVATLPCNHWLLSHPMDVQPMQTEFGWTATPLKAAVGEYMDWLRTHDE